MGEKGKRFSEQFFFNLGLFLLAVAIPCSNFLMSIAQFILIINWFVFGIIESSILKRFITFFKNKHAVCISLLYFIYLIGVIYSPDFGSGFHELKIKLPLLVIPLVISTSLKHITSNTKKRIPIGFVGATIVSAFINFYIFFYTQSNLTDIRDMSKFISHIRFSLCIVLSLFWILKLIKKQQPLKNIIGLFSLAWLSYYLIISQSMTGILIALVSLPIYGIYYFKNRKTNFFKVSAFLLLILPAIYFFNLIYTEAFFYSKAKKINNSSLLQTSKKGYAYEHKLENTQIENGHYIWRNVCYPELQIAWNSVSENKFWGKDNQNNLQYAVLIRYMTSKGLVKDSEGFKELTNEDILAIENGVTNYRFSTMNGVQKRIYETLWEFDYFKHGANPVNGSLVQRLAFNTVGLKTAIKKPLLGHGSGSITESMKSEYLNSSLKNNPNYWLKPHNQFITILIQFGFVGCILFIASLIASFNLTKNNVLYTVFIITAVLSMIAEDTLDTQAGITFFAFFQCYFGLENSKINN